MSRTFTSTLCLLALGTLLACTGALAQTFEVKGVDVEPGKTTVESNNTVFGGFPANVERTRSSHELAFGYGFTDWLKLVAKASFDKPLDEAFQFSTTAIEGQATLKKFQGGLGIAWFTEVALAIDRAETNAVTFGPILQFGTEATQFLINPFFSKTFGRNREDGTEFSYAWALKQQIRDGFSVGIEGYGNIANIGHASGLDLQPHRVGPMFYFERELGSSGLSVKHMGKIGHADEKPKLAMELGILFGLTDAAQDVAVKFKAGVEF